MIEECSAVIVLCADTQARTTPALTPLSTRDRRVRSSSSRLDKKQSGQVSWTDFRKAKDRRRRDPVPDRRSRETHAPRW
jgi:hypothetical protein